MRKYHEITSEIYINSATDMVFKSGQKSWSLCVDAKII